MRTAIRQKKDLNEGRRKGEVNNLTMPKSKIIEMASLLEQHGYSVYAFNYNVLSGIISLKVIPK